MALVLAQILFLQLFLSYHFKSGLKPGSVSSVAETQRHSMGDLAPVPAAVTQVSFRGRKIWRAERELRSCLNQKRWVKKDKGLSGGGRVFPTYSHLSHGCDVFKPWPQLCQKQSLYFSIIQDNLKFLGGRKYKLGYSVFSVILQFKLVSSGFPFLPFPLEGGLKVSGTAWLYGFGDGENICSLVPGISSPCLLLRGNLSHCS